MIQARHYQSKAVRAAFEYLRRTKSDFLLELPTGTGKAFVNADIVREAFSRRPSARIMCLTHSMELVAQNAAEFEGIAPLVPYGIYSAGIGRRDTHQSLIFAGIQSVHKMAWAFSPMDLVIIDECHLVSEKDGSMYRAFLAELRLHNPDMRVIGLTATAYRLSSGRLDEGDNRLFDVIAYRYTLGEAVAEGFLAPLISKKTALNLDGSGVKIRGGEFVEGELQAALDTDDLVRKAVTEIIEFGEQQRRKAWMAFCTGIDHAEHVAAVMNLAGVPTACISSRTEKGERKDTIDRFKAGHLRCLTNANVLTTGFNVKAVDLIAMLRPTLSTGLYVQMMGRGTRPLYEEDAFLPETGDPDESPDVFEIECRLRREAIAAGPKKNCLVLDFAGNVRRHGPVDSIEGPKRGKKKAGVGVESAMARECPECGSLVHISKRVCEDCGHEWPARSPDHASTADSESAVMSSEVQDVWMEVKRAIYQRWPGKDGRPDTLRIDYVCGTQRVLHWVCPLHGGLPGEKGRAWLKAMGMEDEDLLDIPSPELCHVRLRKVTDIMVRPKKNAKDFDDVTHWMVEGDEVIDDRGRVYAATRN